LRQPGDIGTILRPIRRDLVADEIVSADHFQSQTIDVDRQTARPCVVEFDAVDARGTTRRTL